METKNLHWLAGLFEGEASFSIGYQTGHKYPYPVIAFGTVDKDVGERVAALVGVAVCGPRQLPSGKGLYQVRITHKRAWELMDNLYPLLSTRRQARIDELKNILI